MGSKATRGSVAKIRIAAVGDDKRSVRARLDQLEPAAKVIKEKKAVGEDLIAMSLSTYEALCRAAGHDGANGAGASAANDSVPTKDASPRQASVRVWREFRGMTQDELARKVGLSKSFLSEIENGKKTGSIRTLRSIADALDIELTRLAV